MAEPEELIADVARIAVDRVRGWWRQRGDSSSAPCDLDAITPRLELLLLGVTGRALLIRPAPPPLPPTALARWWGRSPIPMPTHALPATNGTTIWLPPVLSSVLSPDPHAGSLRRAMALQQAVKALRGSADIAERAASPPLRDLVLLLETLAADAWLVTHLPGTAGAIAALRAHALGLRPPLERFAAPAARQFEQWLREALLCPPLARPRWLRGHGVGDPSLTTARQLLDSLAIGVHEPAATPLLCPDGWTGRLEAPGAAITSGTDPATPSPTAGRPGRSARLERSPRVRAPLPDEDRATESGPWAVQLDTPLQHAEDPEGLQRPTDRDADADTAALADGVSALDAARLVRTPGPAFEVLLSDVVLPRTPHSPPSEEPLADGALCYPEWDYRAAAYRRPGATVHLSTGAAGDDAWIARTLERHRARLAPLRRRFEQLRARRVTLRRQPDGAELDIDACIADRADARVGLPRSQRLYRQERPARRDMAVLLLIDISASTDAWIAGTRRVIDVEREALLLLCVALDALGESYAMLGFSGETVHGVEVRTLKGFDEPGSHAALRRIAALAPERYTRVGAALRHATALLLRQAATHRLLLLLSDGKPNDVDDYDGPYGVHDLRQAVNEAKCSGVHPFCLTVERTAPSTLPAVFGRGGYALLQQPERLPIVLLDWLRRLVTT